ncbi:MAG: UbiD family decarboxylase [Gammaproteobacteria bacterium]|jgi:UbiD family decarboxylase|nr:UbiD family decarboxylase [Gammaproteobacteria bacterium]MDP6617079.1 UbiD family decarboxylase [Gammaproteobacteria bacterium]MDP7041628.1 UbiD family decarboxylase [Gammaproteobacteria bacterium]
MSDDTKKKGDQQLLYPFSRREFLTATGAGLAAASPAVASGSSLTATAASATVKQAPFESLRDYVQMLEARGLLLRIDRINQDAYEATALMYRLVDRYGWNRAPVVLFEEVKVDGRWIKGPVVANLTRHVDVEALLFGVEPVPGDATATYARARAHFDQLIEKGRGAYPTIAPVEVSREDAPCKEVMLEGDEIDVRSFPFLQNNPGDSGRFINTASIWSSDPERGLNIGTYRCEIKGPRHIAILSGEGQTTYNMWKDQAARGETSAPVTLAIGQDPVVWIVGSSRIPARRGKEHVDEMAIAGGLRGRAIEVVRSETNDFLVPAHSEMIIEGTVSLVDSEPNGPYGERSGYIGANYEGAFPMTVTHITHRRAPWIFNDFTGVTRALPELPVCALETAGLKYLFPAITDYRFVDSVAFFSIKKSEPGQALDIGKRLAEFSPVWKIVMFVDDDVNLWNPADLFMAFATRWQPHPASHIYEDMMAVPLEPSSPSFMSTSNIVIDATRQWPEEGGPKRYPDYSRDVLADFDPEIFERVDTKWMEEVARRFG